MINELCKRAYEMAVSKGWYEESRSALERQMLMVSEIAEACECARNDEPPIHFGSCDTEEADTMGYRETARRGKKTYFLKPLQLGGSKPEGELVELADAMIRIFDYCGSKGWDLEQAIRLKMEYNASRPYRHGGKLA